MYKYVANILKRKTCLICLTSNVVAKYLLNNRAVIYENIQDETKSELITKCERLRWRPAAFC